jgi:general secretion pathway protein G
MLREQSLINNQKGLSLIEILIALTLIGIAGTFVVGQVNNRLQEGKVESARIQIQRLGETLKDYRRKCNIYPTSEQGLDALLNRPTGGRECKRYPPEGFIEGGKIPLDPWDNEFFYESDGRTFTIISYGADGAEGGDGFDADINSNDM